MGYISNAQLNILETHKEREGLWSEYLGAVSFEQLFQVIFDKTYLQWRRLLQHNQLRRAISMMCF
uniref:Uncharacterized protein n=1 Tax=Helianthus annuus TaxID=4232 RepID=A0A251UVF7_HELAN